MQQQPSPDDQRNLIIAAGLSFGVILLWQFFVIGPQQEEARLRAEAERQQSQIEQSEKAPDAAAAIEGASPFADEPISVEDALARSARVKIDTPSVEGSISLTGARIDALRLKKHRETIDPDSPDVEVLFPVGTGQAYFAQFGWVSRGGVTPTNSISAQWALAPGSPDTLRPDAPVTLLWDNGSGLQFKRVVAVDDRYMFTITQSVENRGESAASLVPIAQLERRGDPKRTGMWILHEGPIGVFDGSLQEIDYSDLKEAAPISVGSNIRGERFEVAEVGWLGFTDKYWMAALAPQGPQPFTAILDTKSGAGGQPVYRARAIYPERTVAPGETVSVTTRFFAGAKEIGALRDYTYLLDGQQEPPNFVGKLYDFFFYSGHSRFTDAIDWGWFFFLTKPIFEILTALYAAIGNMGVCIILMTMIFKLLLFPLAFKAYVAMAKVKKLQPEMKRIQESHADDKMKMQQELMALYKREKANPAAGCLPMVLQIPIFFSLYKVLFVTIEMRHAPFFGWIQDLSAPDPTSVLNLFGLLPWGGMQDVGFLSLLAIGVFPIIMGITMWIQQMLNPAPADPTQAQVFNMLPLLFTFMLGHFASGLVIYWTANNLFTIIQQYTIMRSQGVDVDILGNIKRQLGLAPKESQS